MQLSSARARRASAGAPPSARTRRQCAGSKHSACCSRFSSDCSRQAGRATVQLSSALRTCFPCRGVEGGGTPARTDRSSKTVHLVLWVVAPPTAAPALQGGAGVKGRTRELGSSTLSARARGHRTVRRARRQGPCLRVAPHHADSSQCQRSRGHTESCRCGRLRNPAGTPRGHQ